MCFTFIFAAFVLFLIFWGVNVHSYNSIYRDPVTGNLYKMMADTNAAMLGNLFTLYPQFRNFTFSMLRKFIRASIIIYLMDSFGWYWIRYIIPLTVALTYMNYAGRKEVAKKETENVREFLIPILRASKRTLWFDVLMLALAAIARALM